MAKALMIIAAAAAFGLAGCGEEQPANGPAASVTTDAAQSAQQARPEGDPDVQARVRVDGAAGGTGEPLAAGERGGTDVGAQPHVRDLSPRLGREGRVHDEASSERDRARGAR
jgi:predicted small lipoprotein YifL